MTTMKADAVFALNLGKSYCQSSGIVNVINNLSFQVEKGSVFAIRGQNGTGKSTLLRLIAGILHPNQGEIRSQGTMGILLAGEKEAYPRLTVRENLKFFAALNGITFNRCREMVTTAAKNWQLQNLIDRRCDSLSVGEAKRFGLMRASLHEPELLLLDEPLAGLDDRGIDLTKQLIREWRLRGHTVIFTRVGDDALNGLSDEELRLNVATV